MCKSLALILVPMSSKLWIVGTPIGNLGDISERAIEVLSAVDVILAEDTRQTRKLLNHFNIATPTWAFHEHSTEAMIKKVIERLSGGESFALVSDAGMPGISDPGAALVARVRREVSDITITAVPGPSAVTMAFALSGHGSTAFTFLGFLPRSGKERAAALSDLSKARHPTLFFESPQRLRSTLESLKSVLEPTRRIWIFRELTKLYEEVIADVMQSVIGRLQPQVKGEITVMVDADTQIKPKFDETQRAHLWRWARRLRAHGAHPKALAKELAAMAGGSVSEYYAKLVEDAE